MCCVVKVLTKTRKDRPAVKNVMKESRPIAWEPRLVRTVSRVSTCIYRNHLVAESVQKKKIIIINKFVFKVLLRPQGKS